MSKELCVYRYGEYLKHVNVLSNGAVIIGTNFSIDGFSEKPVRVITHAHADHVRDIESSLKYSKHVVASPITLDLIEALSYVSRDLSPLLKSKGVPLAYHQEFSFNGDRLEFYKSDHIPGSAQVLVKLKNGDLKVGYTGDFKLTDKTDIMEGLDVLITEATYGNPLQVRSFKESIPQILVDLVVEGLAKYRRVYIYAYHGKMQEAMTILRAGGIKSPFILPERVHKATKILEEKYGFNYGRYYRERDPVNSKNGLIVFKHFNTAYNRRLDGSGLHIVLTGRFTKDPFVKVDDYTYVVSLSDHADFTDLIKYVELASPKLVVVDGSRSSNAEFLKAALIERGFCTTVLP
ncbi:MAG: MBL fold metallo-hydrolase [Desulfurococcaceae archaeon]